MDFLGREVNLEFEVKVKRKRIAQDAQRREQDKKRAQEAIKEIREKLNLIPLDQQRSEGAGQFLAPPSNSGASFLAPRLRATMLTFYSYSIFITIHRTLSLELPSGSPCQVSFSILHSWRDSSDQLRSHHGGAQVEPWLTRVSS
jgi:hypothetical protein